ncbi:hypothetical protein TraAM80_04552 [Trypanosoma rangeli]|uniref:Uncharacterized protein n=1 Tax=Trypanosoma rangeli TaxID=5698 RepID=A0A3R7RJK1_TRYRA|nr:uncharacterized protein TraAM80_04552 [Trypanosoma rangeli]RNF05451.1 hypothetical protein TraAM80_04552 [Trypanosoma rangeli]|eukprot:RNF05451.1 hypothetical protein TraAM80_04552 [Trypanosoma rangeli]
MEFATQLEGEGMSGSLVKISEQGEHVYATSFSPDGKFLAAVLGDSTLVILDSSTLHVQKRATMGKSYEDLPSTGVRWLTQKEVDQYILVSVSCAGGVFLWTWDGQNLYRTAKMHEEGNEIICLEVCLDTDEFLTAGSDHILRYYEADGTLKGILCKGFDEDGYSRTTHTNRIFSVRFTSPTMAVSGGWGSPIQIWDMRSMESRKQIVGTQVGADGIEPIPNTTCIIVTSKRSVQQLQVFDCVSGDELEEASARLSAEVEGTITLLSRYCKKTDLLWILTAQNHKVLVMSYSTGKLLASCELPISPMNLQLSDHFPYQAIISCAGGKLFHATVKT